MRRMNETLISAISSSGTATRYDWGIVRLCDANPVACQVNTNPDNHLAVIMSSEEVHDQSSVYQPTVNLPRLDTVGPCPLQSTYITQ